ISGVPSLISGGISGFSGVLSLISGGISGFSGVPSLISGATHTFSGDTQYKLDKFDKTKVNCEKLCIEFFAILWT
ncbi:hypothetical protein, partial [Lysinibacillus sp. NPDC086135]|uniref:hypothetical protein n=1 Tax=Lysinibacillus sp. NPDC086135 TaxID=3364130 RepID=UPI00381E982D